MSSPDSISKLGGQGAGLSFRAAVPALSLGAAQGDAGREPAEGLEKARLAPKPSALCARL